MLRFRCIECDNVLRVSNSKNNKKVYQIKTHEVTSFHGKDTISVEYTGTCKRCN